MATIRRSVCALMAWRHLAKVLNVFVRTVRTVLLLLHSRCRRDELIDAGLPDRSQGCATFACHDCCGQAAAEWKEAQVGRAMGIMTHQL